MSIMKTMPICERITRREQKKARSRANELMQQMRRILKDKYRMTFRIAGSGCWGTMVKRPDGHYDLDYQIIITHNSKDYERTVIKKPEKVKEDIRRTLDGLKNKGESFKNSTTAITMVNKDESIPYSIDFVILTDVNGEFSIIKQNKKEQPPTYTWAPLPSKFNNCYSYFKKLNSDGKKVIVDRTIRRKCEEMHKSSPDKTSCEIFVEEIKNYANENGVHF